MYTKCALQKMLMLPSSKPTHASTPLQHFCEVFLGLQKDFLSAVYFVPNTTYYQLVMYIADDNG